MVPVHPPEAAEESSHTRCQGPSPPGGWRPPSKQGPHTVTGEKEGLWGGEEPRLEPAEPLELRWQHNYLE